MIYDCDNCHLGIDENTKKLTAYELLLIDREGYKEDWRLCSLKCIIQFAEKLRIGDKVGDK
jgi:hypothetical protein